MTRLRGEPEGVCATTTSSMPAGPAGELDAAYDPNLMKLRVHTRKYYGLSMAPVGTSPSARFIATDVPQRLLRGPTLFQRALRKKPPILKTLLRLTIE